MPGLSLPLPDSAGGAAQHPVPWLSLGSGDLSPHALGTPTSALCQNDAMYNGGLNERNRILDLRILDIF